MNNLPGLYAKNIFKVIKENNDSLKIVNQKTVKKKMIALVGNKDNQNLKNLNNLLRKKTMTMSHPVHMENLFKLRGKLEAKLNKTRVSNWRIFQRVKVCSFKVQMQR